MRQNILDTVAVSARALEKNLATPRPTNHFPEIFPNSHPSSPFPWRLLRGSKSDERICFSARYAWCDHDRPTYPPPPRWTIIIDGTCAQPSPPLKKKNIAPIKVGAAEKEKVFQVREAVIIDGGRKKNRKNIARWSVTRAVGVGPINKRRKLRFWSDCGDATRSDFDYGPPRPQVVQRRWLRRFRLMETRGWLLREIVVSEAPGGSIKRSRHWIAVWLLLLSIALCHNPLVFLNSFQMLFEFPALIEFCQNLVRTPWLGRYCDLSNCTGKI